MPKSGRPGSGRCQSVRVRGGSGSAPPVSVSRSGWGMAPPPGRGSVSLAEESGAASPGIGKGVAFGSTSAAKGSSAGGGGGADSPPDAASPAGGAPPSSASALARASRSSGACRATWGSEGEAKAIRRCPAASDQRSRRTSVSPSSAMSEGLGPSRPSFCWSTTSAASPSPASRSCRADVRIASCALAIGAVRRPSPRSAPTIQETRFMVGDPDAFFPTGQGRSPIAS